MCVCVYVCVCFCVCVFLCVCLCMCSERLIILLSAVPDASGVIFEYLSPYNILFSFVIFMFDWHVALTEFWFYGMYVCVFMEV